MDFKPETLRLFIGMLFSASGILLFNFIKVKDAVKLNNDEVLLSWLGSITLFIIGCVFLLNLLKKGG